MYTSFINSIIVDSFTDTDTGKYNNEKIMMMIRDHISSLRTQWKYKWSAQEIVNYVRHH